MVAADDLRGRQALSSVPLVTMLTVSSEGNSCSEPTFTWSARSMSPFCSTGSVLRSDEHAGKPHADACGVGVALRIDRTDRGR